MLKTIKEKTEIITQEEDLLEQKADFEKKN